MQIEIWEYRNQLKPKIVIHLGVFQSRQTAMYSVNAIATGQSLSQERKLPSSGSKWTPADTNDRCV